MPDRDLHSPDSRYETVSKDTTRDYDRTLRNTQRPDHSKIKDEITVDDDEDDYEEDEDE